MTITYKIELFQYDQLASYDDIDIETFDDYKDLGSIIANFLEDQNIDDGYRVVVTLEKNKKKKSHWC